MSTIKRYVSYPIIVLGFVTGSALAAGSSSGPSSNTLNLQWQGTIPVPPVTTGAWKFVSSTDPSKPFVPTLGMITVGSAAVDGEKTLTASPVSFSIRGTSGLTASSSVTAYLASPITFTGLNADASATDAEKAATMEISVGGTTIKIGSGSAVKVADAPVTAAANSGVDITVTGKGNLKTKAYTPGDTFTASATLVFTADAV
ncbi:TPA: hypothetical protein MND73_004645 [Salmonella enterica subsp. houtenae]|nr:hypothetical protein [Salmonella enterica subsp. houtenae]